MNRSAKSLLIAATNFNGFSLARITDGLPNLLNFTLPNIPAIWYPVDMTKDFEGF